MANDLEKYEKAAGMMPGSVIIFQLQPDDTMKVLFYSQKAKELTGMAKAEVDSTVQPNGFNMIIEDDQEVIKEKIKQAIATGEELDVTYRQHHKVEGMVWVHMKAAIAGEVDGLPVFIASLLDVTHEMLNSSSIMEAADTSICVIEKSTKLLLYGNSKFYALIDRKPSESMGVYCYDTLCGNPAFKHDNKCLCFSTINIEKPFEYYNPDTKQYLSMYGREIMWGEHEAYVFYLTDQTEEKFKEKQLKNAQERFEMTLDNSDLYIWEYDIINSQCINPQKAVREYGLPPVIDNYPEALYELGHTPPETVEQIKQVKQRLLNGETGFSVERRTVDGSGESQWMRVSYTLEKDSTGRPMRALVCGTDITEQKEMEEKYAEQMEYRNKLAQNAMFSVRLDLDADTIEDYTASDRRILTFVNEAHGAADFLSNFFQTSIFDETGDVSRELLTKQGMEKSFAKGQSQYHTVYRCTRFNLYLELSLSMYRNPGNKHLEVFYMIADVTQATLAQNAYQRVVALDYDFVAMINPATGKMRFLAQAEQAVLPQHTKNSDQNDYEKLVMDFAKAFRKYYATEEDYQAASEGMSLPHVIAQLETVPVYEFICKTRAENGEPHTFRLRFAYTDANRDQIVITRSNISHVVAAEQRSQQLLESALSAAQNASRAKTEFLSRMSHDIRTPLNGIIGMTDVAMHDNKEEKVGASLELIASSSHFLLSLINDILDISKIENGSMVLKERPVPLGEFDKAITSVIQPLMDSKDIEFVYGMHCGMQCACIDPVRFNQVFLNLLSNAAKYTPAGGKVEFLAEHLSEDETVEWVRFTVRDNGIGMSPEFLARAFVAFEQDESANEALQNHGTGLGLAICKDLVELMGGRITVKSAVGKGSEFVVDMPLKKAALPAEELAEKRMRRAEDILAGKTVLLAEDNRINALVATRLLEAKGMKVEVVENGELAVQRFAQAEPGTFAAILMDMRMPVMGGLQATKTIRKMAGRPEAAGIPIIAMTANAFDDDVNNCLAAGMNAHLAKPIEPEKMYQTIADALR